MKRKNDFPLFCLAPHRLFLFSNHIIYTYIQHTLSGGYDAFAASTDKDTSCLSFFFRHLLPLAYRPCPPLSMSFPLFFNRILLYIYIHLVLYYIYIVR